MIQRKMTVTFEMGLHAQPVARLTQIALKYEANSWLARLDSEERINCKQPMALMSMNVRFGEELLIFADGSDDGDAIEALLNVFKSASK